MVSLLQEWVTKQADQRNDAIAVVMNQEQTSYGALEEASNQLGRLLRALGCARGDRVCLLMPKSAKFILGVFGTLKADCIYVPLDIASPSTRLARIIAISEPRCILVAGSVTSLLLDTLAEAHLRNAPAIGWMDFNTHTNEAFQSAFTLADLENYSGAPLISGNNSDDPAHILFTSGSTGVPKGVTITHRNVIHFIEWAIGYLGISQADRLSHHPPFHFDLSTFDLFGAFAAGAQLHLVPPELNLLPNKLADFIRESSLTHWLSVPSVLNYLAKSDVVKFGDFPMLRRLSWCGEVFPTSYLRYWMQRLPNVSFTNFYGPTEATIASSYYAIPRCPTGDNDSIPIGGACAGEELLILDDELKPTAQGEIGNLYISGVGLSSGYWQDEEKTASVFLKHPLDGRRIYRTGDLARMGKNGLVYFLGREDSQIKSRGYRIELGEIEAALNELRLLQDCSVIAIESGGFEGSRICCAYVPLMGVKVTPSLLRRSLSKLIPNYMFPTRWMPLDYMPQNTNGKCDRSRLRGLFQEAETRVESTYVKIEHSD